MTRLDAATDHARRYREAKARRAALAEQVGALKQQAKDLRAEITARQRELAQAIAEQDAAAEAAAESLLTTSASDDGDVEQPEAPAPAPTELSRAAAPPSVDADPADAFVDVIETHGLRRFDVYSAAAPDSHISMQFKGQRCHRVLPWDPGWRAFALAAVRLQHPAVLAAWRFDKERGWGLLAG